MAGGGRQINAVKGTASCTASPAKPCDVASLTLTVTDADKKPANFSTSRKLTGDPPEPKTPAHVVSALKSAEFYIEVLGSSGVAGTEAKQARLTATSTYIGGCGSSLHVRPYLSGGGLVNKPVAGPILLQSTPDGGNGRYSLIASACGRPANLATKRTISLRADIVVFPPQDWKVTVASPTGLQFGFSHQDGVKKATKTSRRTFGNSKESETTKDRLSGESSVSSKVVKGGLTTEESLTSRPDAKGETLTQETKVSTETGFFQKHELKEVSKTEGGASNKVLEREFKEKKNKFDSGDLEKFKIEVEKDGKTVFDTGKLKDDIDTAMSAFEGIGDVLNSFPKLGYWAEVSVGALAIEAEFTLKRYGARHVGKRYVCIDREWSATASGKLLEVEIELGAGLKLQALGSIRGGAELYAYLSGTAKGSVDVRLAKKGYDEPSEAPPDPPTTAPWELEGKLHGKASVVGFGWEYQRTAEMKGKLQLYPQFVGDGFRLRTAFVNGRVRYKLLEKDFWGRPREYEIKSITALRAQRLSDAEIEELDSKEDKSATDACVIDIMLRSSPRYVSFVKTTRSKAAP